MINKKENLGGTFGEGETSKIVEDQSIIETGQENVQATDSSTSKVSADSQTKIDPFSEKHICSICGAEFVGFGNHPWPIIDTGEPCCDDCNRNVVLPARWEKISSKQ